MFRKFYRLNQYIAAKEVRVVDELGKQIGVLTTTEALKKAQEKDLDLVEIAPQAKPPVCKLIKFEKFKFLENKKRQEEKRRNKKVAIKEVRFTPFIAENDFNFRVEKAKKFLKEGNKVKASVFFRGREITKRSFGQELLKKVKLSLASFGTIDLEPKFIGRQLEMLFKPFGEKKNGVKDKTQNQKIAGKKI